MADDHDTHRIADELEIRNLLARLAHLADDGELEELSVLINRYD